ncbi:hypothetical protein [Salibacterium qingdaonense]|uniref:Uncharacterized protein n=1 Tax=Salibacterium qingdaonense TaxID=266892 RepID=A0A1I4KQ41_9BACI|nr:hypothetical protein [Salibacterium qingdaonense]SFL80888.1 hypothetical protein SAMN04488054_105158 [Salibacterium qingdaonense]
MNLSAKFITVNQLEIVINQLKEIGDDNDFQVLLMTPFGFLKGDIEDITDKDGFMVDSPDNPDAMRIDLSYLVKMKNDFLKDPENQHIEITNDDGTLNLVNVEIYKDTFLNPIATLPQMLVFVDQIISCAIVPRENNFEVHE